MGQQKGKKHWSNININNEQEQVAGIALFTVSFLTCIKTGCEPISTRH